MARNLRDIPVEQAGTLTLEEARIFFGMDTPTPVAESVPEQQPTKSEKPRLNIAAWEAQRDCTSPTRGRPAR